MNTIALNVYNRTRYSSIEDFNYLWTEPQMPTRLKGTTYQACLGRFYSWSFCFSVMKHPHQVLHLLGSFQHSAVVFIDYRIKNNISFLATIFIFIFYNWTTYLAWLRLMYSWNFLATRLFFLSEKIDWQIWTSCLLVRNGWLTYLLARKGWLT